MYEAVIPAGMKFSGGVSYFHEKIFLISHIVHKYRVKCILNHIWD